MCERVVEPEETSEGHRGETGARQSADEEIARLEQQLKAAKCKRKRERSSERMRRLHADPEFKAQQSERMRRLNADPWAKVHEGLRKHSGSAEGRA